jgi:hypothetical protein
MDDNRLRYFEMFRLMFQNCTIFFEISWDARKHCLFACVEYLEAILFRLKSDFSFPIEEKGGFCGAHVRDVCVLCCVCVRIACAECCVWLSDVWSE